MNRLRRWTCGLWRYLRGYHRHPEHKRPRGDRDDLYLPEPAKAEEHDVACTCTPCAVVRAQAIGYWSAQAWVAIGATPYVASTYDRLLAMATALNDAWLDRLFTPRGERALACAAA